MLKFKLETELKRSDWSTCVGSGLRSAGWWSNRPASSGEEWRSRGWSWSSRRTWPPSSDQVNRSIESFGTWSHQTYNRKFEAIIWVHKPARPSHNASGKNPARWTGINRPGQANNATPHWYLSTSLLKRLSRYQCGVALFALLKSTNSTGWLWRIQHRIGFILIQLMIHHG